MKRSPSGRHFDRHVKAALELLTVDPEPIDLIGRVRGADITARRAPVGLQIRDHHIASEAMGVNNALYKSLAFGVSAMYTGIAGALGAIAVQFVAPDSFNIFLSIIFLVGIVVGGLGSISGAVYGALFIQFVPNIADEVSKAAPWAVFGILMIVFVYLMPTGVAGALRLITAKRRAP